MHAFHHGELLIGGVALRHLDGELDREEQSDNAHDWLLAGRVQLPAHGHGQLELSRQYLLRLADGREGFVQLTHLEAENGRLRADFQPKAKNKSA